jgi:cytochrome c oxidase subunit II
MFPALQTMAFAALSLLAAPALAEETAEKAIGMAKPWQLNFQEPATPVMERLISTHDFLLWVITAICVFVLLGMAYICIRFRRKANPIASKTTHNTMVEVVWTTIPILILITIAIPSLRLHYFMQKVDEPEMTLKAVGHQWYWHYEYPDHGGFGFDSYMLEVDNRVVVPVDTTVRLQLTGADVIHAWAMPAFGVKKDAMPGRLNETWFKAEKIGTFYGQCSELCGVGHGFMPIAVDVVSKEDFAKWVAKKREENGIVDEKTNKTQKDKKA